MQNTRISQQNRTTKCPSIKARFEEEDLFHCCIWIFAFEQSGTVLFNQFLGDIDIVAAVGDSLTSATAANSAALWEVLVENRGLSWCIGGLSRKSCIYHLNLQV